MEASSLQPAQLLTLLDRAIGAARDDGTQGALLLLGLERLDFVNWHLDISGSDAILDAAQERLCHFLPPGSVHRLWNGKFSILTSAADSRDALTMAHRLVALCSAPFRVAAQDVFTPPFIGVSMICPSHPDGAALLRDALFALEDARSSHSGGVRIYDPVRKIEAEKRFEIENCLRSAFETGNQFRVVYQPLVRLNNDGSIGFLGFESLTRWTSPHLGAIPPDKFIPIAERCGLIQGLGNFVLWEACRQQVEWAEKYDRKVAMSVNLSPVQLMATGLEDTVTEAISGTGIDPACLKLEVTETALAVNPPFLAEKLARLRKTGVSIGVDDFGSGYSSLGQLDLFGLDFMKIDKSLIQRLGPGERQTELVRLTTKLAKHLNMQVVAEGIEDANHLNMLMELGVDIGQGYLFDRPLPPDQAEKWLTVETWQPPSP